MRTPLSSRTLLLVGGSVLYSVLVLLGVAVWMWGGRIEDSEAREIQEEMNRRAGQLAGAVADRLASAQLELSAAALNWGLSEPPGPTDSDLWLASGDGRWADMVVRVDPTGQIEPVRESGDSAALERLRVVASRWAEPSPSDTSGDHITTFIRPPVLVENGAPERIVLGVESSRSDQGTRSWYATIPVDRLLPWLGGELFEGAGLDSSTVALAVVADETIRSVWPLESTSNSLSVDWGPALPLPELDHLGTAPFDASNTLFPSGAFAPLGLALGIRGSTVRIQAARVGRRFRWTGWILLGLAGAGATLLLAATVRARTVAERQSAFVGLISHELRTPLTALRGGAENLADGVVRDPDRVEEYARNALVQVERLERLAEDALHLARGARPDPGHEPVEVRALVAEAVDRAAIPPDRTTDTTDTTEVRVETIGPGSIRVGRDPVVRALVNVLCNAHLHGAPPIEIVARREGPDWIITVRDHGPGVPESGRARLFEPFQRGPTARGNQTPGSGLGLTVARQAVSACGGTLELDDPKSGSGMVATFTFRACDE